MIETIFYFGISGLLYVSCAAALPVQHVPNERNLQQHVEYSILNETCSNKTQNATMESDDDVIWDCMERNRLKLIISKLMLSASCTSETEYLIDNVDALFVPGVSSYCIDVNNTARSCPVEIYTNVNETTCIDSGGQFYDNYTEPTFHICFNINNGDEAYITNIGLSNYPICVGASCNTSEVQSALDGLIQADYENGLLGSHVAYICNSVPTATPTSSVHNSFNDYGIVMCFTFSILASVLYVF